MDGVIGIGIGGKLGAGYGVMSRCARSQLDANSYCSGDVAVR